MRHWGESPFEPELAAEAVLGQMEMAVIVCDRFSNIIHINAFAKKLFGFAGSEYIGQSVLSLWFGAMAITLEDDGDTLLTGPVEDQAALHGLLRKVCDLGMPLISAIRVKPP